MKKLVIILIVAILIGFSIFLLSQLIDDHEELVGDIHIHADFKVYMNNEQINFNQTKYLSDGNKSLSNFLHEHDHVGDVMHAHIGEIPISHFFSSIGMKFNSTCFVLDTGGKFL